MRATLLVGLALASCSDEAALVEDAGALDLAAARPDLTRTGCDPPCVAPTPRCNAAFECVACLSDDDCPAGRVCRAPAGSEPACLPGCSDDARCRAGGGPPTMTCCAMACVDTASDAANCGGCGQACAPAHAAGACAAGRCAPVTCNAGWGDCDGDPADGCEVNLRADAANCTACGKACNLPGGVAGCAHGCYLAACLFGFDDCNRSDADGCETAVLSDAKNCGGCGASCGAVVRGQVACVGGLCAIKGCDPGFADCNGVYKDGCEVSLLTDRTSCGRCGEACAQGLVCANGGCTCPQCNLPNAISKCVNNICILDQCNAGFGDCDGNAQNGCEVATANNAKNCGACGNVCPQNQPVCIAGKCAAGCAYSMVVLASSPIGYWPLDEMMGGTAVDKSGTPHNGAIQGAPQLGVPGVAGTAMLFHGNADHIRIGAASSGTTTEVSYEFWVRLDAQPGAAITAIWDDDFQGGGDAWIEVLPGGKLQVRRSPDGFVDFATNGALTVGQWHHFVLVADAGGKKLYINGVLDASTGVVINARTNRSYVTVGANYDGASFPGGAQYFAGGIDEVAIYGRALSANEVKAHFDAACAR